MMIICIRSNRASREVVGWVEPAAGPLTKDPTQPASVQPIEPPEEQPAEPPPEVQPTRPSVELPTRPPEQPPEQQPRMRASILPSALISPQTWSTFSGAPCFIFAWAALARRTTGSRNTLTASQSRKPGASTLSHTNNGPGPINTSRRRLSAARSVISAQRSAIRNSYLGKKQIVD